MEDIDASHIEPNDAAHPDIPDDLLELHQILEWEKAVAEGPDNVALEGFTTI